MNQKPCLCGRRACLRFDGVNMNRSFPVRRWARHAEDRDYFQRVLLPNGRCKCLDFHRAGKTLDFLPFAASHIAGGCGTAGPCCAARDAFNAPFSVEMREIDALAKCTTMRQKLMGKTFRHHRTGRGWHRTPETAQIRS